jgi:hypothetical protein
MYVIRHHDRSVKLNAFSVIVSAVLKNHIAGIRRERVSVQLSESHEDCPLGLLVMWQPASVVVVVGRNLGICHGLI